MLVEVEDSILKDRPLGDGVKLRCLVSPRNQVIWDEREHLEIANSAADKGFELAFCGGIGMPGIARWLWEKKEHAIMVALREKIGINVRSFAVSITPVARMVKYS